MSKRPYGTGTASVSGAKRKGKTWTESCDYLACGLGPIPGVELPALFGCSVNETGAAVDACRQTSVTEIYCAGEATGIGGLDLALVESEIAGYLLRANRTVSSRKLWSALSPRAA